MRVVAGRPDPIAQTPMMNAFIRYVALNPYWNSPPDITATQACADHPQGGPRLFQEPGLRSSVGLVRPCARDRPDVDRLARGRSRASPGPPAAEAGAGQFDGEDEVHVPQRAGNLAARYAGAGEDRRGRAACRATAASGSRMRRASRAGCSTAARPRPQGARPEQKVNLPAPVPLYITYLTAVPSGTSIVYFDDFYGKDRAQAREPRSRAVCLARLRAALEVPGRSIVTSSASPAWARGGARSNCWPNWTPNLPACAQRTVPRDRARRRRCRWSARSRARPTPGIRPARPSTRCCAASLRSSRRRSQAMARRIRRWRGSRMQWKPSASTRDAVGKLAGRRGVARAGRRYSPGPC